jgi:hypothetical protein
MKHVIVFNLRMYKCILQEHVIFFTNSCLTRCIMYYNIKQRKINTCITTNLNEQNLYNH